MFEWYKKEAPVFTGIARGVGGFGFGKAAGGAAVAAPSFSATGGTKGTVGGVVYHVFTTSGAFTISNPTGSTLNIGLLMVAGGGGGGVIGGGGGGGGVIKSNPTIPIPQSGGPYPITIGQGGNGGGPGAPGTSGGDTTFSNPGGVLLTAKGGGGGGSHQSGYTSASGTPGGSGGGGSDNSGSYPYGNATQPSQPQPAPLTPLISQFGNRGGNGPVPQFDSYNPRSGGGGGGAGAAGQDRGNPTPYGNGGDGTPYTVLTNGDPSTVTEYWFGAGGGAGTYESNNSGNGGKGGAGGGVCSPNTGVGSAGPNGYNAGSPGGTSGAGGAAGANTGGGGGGGQWPGPHAGTRTGGPGIVVITYPTSV